ncbi:MAG: DUF2339 domain-containing protein [Candidatus Moraniibacteriota bacterium]
MSNENNYSEEIISSLNVINSAISDLNQKIELQNERILRLEGGREKAVIVPPAYVAPSSPAPVSVSQPNYQNIEPQPTFQATPSQNLPVSEKSNLEENIGGTWFARIGMAALVLGVSFFLKYAFDNNWIGEVGRVMIGIIAGIALLGLGEKFIRKYFVYGQLMSGGGLAVLYLSIFVAFDSYHLISQIPAFLMMALITAVGIVLSIRYDAISLVIVSTLGGFLTPFLVSTGKNNEVELFSYILILDLAILAISMFKKWRWLNILGFFGTVLVFLSWSGRFYNEEDLFVTMLFLTLFFITYSISSLVYNLVRNEKSSGVEQALTLMAGAIFFASSYAILDPSYHVFMGFFALIMAIYYFLWAYLVRAITPDDENLYSFLAFLTVGFITLAIPLQFEGKIISIGWAIEAVIMIILGIKTEKVVFKAFGTFMFGLATLRLLFIDSGHGNKDMVLLNKVMFTYLIVIILAYASAHIFRLFSRDTEGKNDFLATKQLVALFLIVANFLTVFSLSREITYKYDQDKRAYRVQEEKRHTENIRIGKISDSSYMYEKLDKIDSRSSVSLSLFWLFYGIILVVVGFLARIKGARIGGLLLFTLAILKLFFYDLWSMGTLYRIISSMSLGVVLLTISFAYQKYKDKIKEII